MNIDHYLENLKQEFMTAAEIGGNETQEIAERLLAPLESSIRLVMMEALSDAAAEITVELVPTTVDLRLRGRDPEFVVNKVSPGIALEEGSVTLPVDPASPAETPEGEEDLLRTTVRLPESLKNRIDEAAARQGISVNTWMVRAASSALEPSSARIPLQTKGGQAYRGWV